MTTSLPPAAEAFTQLTRALGGAFNREPIDKTVSFLRGVVRFKAEEPDADIDERVALAIMKPPRHCCAAETVMSRLNRAIMLLEWPLQGRGTMPQEHLDFLRVFLTELDIQLRGVRV